MSTMREFDPMSAYFVANPYQELRRMREDGPAYRHVGTLMPVISVFRYRDIQAMARDWKTWSSQRDPEYNKKALGEAAILIGNDPPLHTKYRDVVAPVFMPGAVSPLVPLIEEQTALTLEECLAAGEINFVEDFAAKTTVRVICRLLGVPLEDGPLMRRMTLELAKQDGCPVFWKKPDPETEARVAKVFEEMGAYFNDYFARKPHGAERGLLDEIAATGAIDPRHMVGLSFLLVGAGNETTTNLMVHGLQELLRHPEQLAMLRNDPGLIDSAIEEMLRFRGTIRKLDRIAAVDTKIGSIDVARGESIALWVASASRDPEVIDRPDEFDITRRPNKHLGFGTGIHMCIGNALARAELRVAFRRLLERTRDIEPTRGEDSYENWGNGVLEAAKRFSVRLLPA